MRASINFELETPEDFAAFATVFGVVSGVGVKPKADVVHAASPEPEKQIAKPVKAAKAEKPVEEKAKVDPSKADANVEAVEAETVDKALVAKELRAFIQKQGDTGPKEALAVLKQFGAAKFDELKPEDYSKFLTALTKG
ncbi:hypothetical protein LGH82_33120 [Mesorhizobium sp. PAMC28654]|uniref:hypothetical protein n=1 Tax=Mesorhizobium sp. PAMC28654 TaxID=2880934 RepID=UPI001D0A8ED5|nr:hypothetical protein [Mesorhizobium sp. PAMC28654]UDL89823.1 hypothetical protein LGH82_33120 [Mesorhizobium sp. PAMC28654]